jgi:hypothetical protein
MAHRSKKKHLKHVHQHEPVTPKAKGPVAKAEAAAAGVAKKGGTVRRAEGLENAGKKPGIVRRITRKASKKIAATKKSIAAKPRKAIARAKSRVKSLLRAA